MNLIECKNLSVSYDSTKVVDDISFAVGYNDYLCIAGENGSGKSTLVKTLLSLKQPSSGSVIFSKDIKKNEIGYLPQRTEVQSDFPASVWEIVLSGCVSQRGLKPFYSKAEKTLAESNLELMSIGELKKVSFMELSTGQQQRVLIARALCSAKKLLVMDEPAAGLDPLITKQLYEMFDAINKSGVALVMVSHDIKSAILYASHVLHLKNSMMFYGTKQEYMESDTGKLYLGEDFYV